MIAKTNHAYAEAFFEALKPDPILTVSEWADEHRVLSTKASSEPGKYRTDRTPYMREIMDVLSDNHPAQTIVFMKSAQVGATEAGNNWIGYTIHHSPAPMMLVMPSLDLAKRNSKGRVDPLIDESPVLRERVKDKRSRDSSNTVFSKEFKGGILVMTGANSASGLRSMPVKKLFTDEIDAYPGDIDGEGDPLDLARARTRTFSRRKHFMPSTPTTAGKSKVEKWFNMSDQRYFHVPCPHCHEKQRLIFSQLKWQKDEAGNPDLNTVTYECLFCEKQIENWQKTKMLKAGEWIPEVPEQGGKVVGYHINSLYSPVGWYSWSELVKDFLDAKGDPTKLKTFVNTVLGEVWKDKSEVPDWQRLYERREPYEIGTVPTGGVFLTAGVDVQADRFEVEIVAWGRNKVSWSVEYLVLPGDTALEATWDQLHELLSRSWPLAEGEGRSLALKMMAVDSGYNTNVVYNWVRKFPQNRVIAVKGQESLMTLIGPPRAVDVRESGKVIRRGIKMWSVGVNLAKQELYGWLRQSKALDGQADNFGYCHFPEYSEEFFKMLTAEELVSKTNKGYVKVEWQKHRERNEALDCRVYARAAAAICGLDRFTEDNFKFLETQVMVVTGVVANQPVQQRKRRESTWL